MNNFSDFFNVFFNVFADLHKYFVEYSNSDTFLTFLN